MHNVRPYVYSRPCFSNSLNYSESISGNLRTSISDHDAQFLIIPHNAKATHQNHNIFKRDTSKFNKEIFVSELTAIDWSSETDISSEDANKSFALLETKINSIIEKHMPMNKLTKKEIKLHQKPWVSRQIRKTMLRRDKTY